MWLSRPNKEKHFLETVLSLKNQVLILSGARQVGKTSFINHVIEKIPHKKIYLNFLYNKPMQLGDKNFYGREFFGKNPDAEDFFKNLEDLIGERLDKITQPYIIFMDEVDRYPIVMESIQTLAERSQKLKFIITGSNLENIVSKNAATGRKKYFDLYPITFKEFLLAEEEKSIENIIASLTHRNLTMKENNIVTNHQHNKLLELNDTYIRLGGMPRILTNYFSKTWAKEPLSKEILLNEPLSNVVKDLVLSIEENIKTILGEKSKLYEYEDILRKLAFLSINTLKLSNLQVSHAGRSEAKKLVNKTVGARIAHKIRLYSEEKDLSKYIIFDPGITNYLLNGADLLKTQIHDKNYAILNETYVGNELIAGLTSRDELNYWKSENKAEVEYILRSPFLTGIDVKSHSGKSHSLDCLAIFENAKLIIKIGNFKPSLLEKHTAKLPNFDKTKETKLLLLPKYLTFVIPDLLNELIK